MPDETIGLPDAVDFFFIAAHHRAMIADGVSIGAFRTSGPEGYELPRRPPQKREAAVHRLIVARHIPGPVYGDGLRHRCAVDRRYRPVRASQISRLEVAVVDKEPDDRAVVVQAVHERGLRAGHVENRLGS